MNNKSVFLALMGATLLGWFGWSSGLGPNNSCPQITVTLPDNTTVKTEVADTPIARTKGLSGRNSLQDGTGMLFLFPDTSIQPFWMKDTHFPLDIIWLDNHVVVATTTLQAETSGQTPTYTPAAKANAVLELAAGSIAIHSIQIGNFLPWTPCS